MEFDDIFANFFGGGGRGGGHQQHHHHHQQQQREEPIPFLFENSDVLQLDLSKVFQFYRRQEIWIIYFFNPKLEECKKFKEEFVSVSERLYGMIKVGAIDCLHEEELCEEFSVYQVPSILIFSENFVDDGDKYEGTMSANNIMNAAAKKMQNFVNVVTSANLDSFIERDRATKHKIILFTEKKATPTVYKALSKKYLERLNFGEVKQSEETLVQQFGITAFPTIIALTDPESLGYDKYEGEINIDQLTKFMGNYAYSTPKKIEITDFTELTEKKMKGGANALCGPKSTNICVIIFTEGEDFRSQLDELKPVIANFSQDPVSFTYIQAKGEPFIHQEVFASSRAVLFKPKRKNYMSLPATSAEALNNAISDALGGGGSWNKASELLFGNIQTEL